MRIICFAPPSFLSSTPTPHQHFQTPATGAAGFGRHRQHGGVGGRAGPQPPAARGQGALVGVGLVGRSVHFTHTTRTNPFLSHNIHHPPTPSPTGAGHRRGAGAGARQALRRHDGRAEGAGRHHREAAAVREKEKKRLVDLCTYVRYVCITISPPTNQTPPTNPTSPSLSPHKRSGGVVQRDSKLRRSTRMRRVHQYFYGPSKGPGKYVCSLGF